MRYKVKYYGGTRFLVYTHKDGVEILGPSLASLMEAVKAYNSIYNK